MRRSDGSFPAFAAEQGSRLRGTAFLLTGDRRDAGALSTAALAAVSRRWRRLDRAAAVPAARAALVRLVLEASVTQPARDRGHTDLTGTELVASADDVPGLPASDVDHADLDDGDRAWLAALAGVPLRARIALVLRLHEELDDAETARLLHTVPTTVAGLVDAALREVAPLLTAPAPDPAPPAAPDPAPATDAADDPDDPDDDPYAIYRRPR